MPVEHILLDCPPISARVFEKTPGWNIVVHLLDLTKTSVAIMDVDAAKNTALAYARQLCQCAFYGKVARG
jgi:hypothetical protein